MSFRDIKSIPLRELSQELTAAGFPAFRAQQLYRWLHVRLVCDYEEMSDLPKDMKTYLRSHYRLTQLTEAERQVSRLDGTQKFLFRLPDNETVESVHMRYHFGDSVCVSSQVGCRMGCRFCASSLDGLTRQLLPGEMLEEVYAIQRSLRPRQSRDSTGDPAACHTAREVSSDAMAGRGRDGGAGRISHVVVMGTGEPLDNYDHVVRFLRMLTDENGLHISARNITVSTCGLVPRMYDLAREGLPVTLALSLHAVTDGKRRQIMPVANRYSIRECVDACRCYAEHTGRRITFEYSLIRGVNDSQEDAERLAELALSVGAAGPARGRGNDAVREKSSGGGNGPSRRKAPAAHVNLIPVNPVAETGLQPPDMAAVQAFRGKLEKHRINVSIRRVMGQDIDGACGQLRHRRIDTDGIQEQSVRRDGPG